MVRPLGGVNPLGRTHGDPEDLAVEEEEGGEGLVLGRGGNAPAGPGEVRQEVPHGRGVELSWMFDVVELDIPPHPGRVNGDGAGAVSPHTEEVAELVEEAGRGHRPRVPTPRK
jgi:hypothetical protein